CLRLPGSSSRCRTCHISKLASHSLRSPPGQNCAVSVEQYAKDGCRFVRTGHGENLRLDGQVGSNQSLGGQDRVVEVAVHGPRFLLVAGFGAEYHAKEWFWLFHRFVPR